MHHNNKQKAHKGDCKESRFTSFERYNNKLYQYRIRIKREINYKQKTRLLELAEIQYTKIQIKSQKRRQHDGIKFSNIFL